MSGIVNVMERLVEETLEDILKTNKDTVCECRRCRLDTVAIALNKLPPAYVVTEEGEVLLRTNSLRQQFKVDIIKAVTAALALVRKRPHHQRE